MRRRLPSLVWLVAVATAAGCQDPGPPSTDDAAGSSVVVLAAGNIATCGRDGDEATAALLGSLEGTVFAAGDNLYPDNPGDSFETCYGPSWGRHRDRTYPVLGNHEYDTGTADPHFDFFGERAGPRGLGYYSLDLGDWHVIVLNSVADRISTERGGAQEAWLRHDLATARNTRCTLAIWHHPRFYQGPWNKNGNVTAFWDALVAAGADVVVNAHFHLYERYAPQDTDGNPDAENGMRQFTVGTGGRGLEVQLEPAPNLEVRDNTSLGVLKLTLAPEHYRWEFVSVAGGTFSDSGSAACH